MVEYEGIFGPHTTLRYTPTFGGFKEDIILECYTGINKFAFRLKTYGLSLVCGDEGYSLIDPLTGEINAAIGEPIVYDSQGEAAMFETDYSHYYIVQTIEPDYEYLVTLVVDETYLLSPDTVWPVTVDPTLTLKPSTSVDDIHDAPVYSGTDKKNTPSGANSYQHIGRVTSSAASWGTGRLLVKFPNLMTKLTNAGITTASQITGATYSMRLEPGYGGPATIGTYYYPGTAWTESTIKCSQVSWSVGALVSTTAVNASSGYVGFNILSAVQSWKASPGTYDPNKGLVFKNNSSESSTAYDRSFYAKEYGNASYQPRLEITYNTPVPVSLICLNKTSVTCRPGEIITLTATLNPSNAADKTVTYTSDNPSVLTFSGGAATVTVTQSDTYWVARGEGTATVTAVTSNGKIAKCVFTVNTFYSSAIYDAKLATQCAEYAMLAYDEMELSGDYYVSGSRKDTPTALISKLQADGFTSSDIEAYHYQNEVDNDVSFVLARKAALINGSWRTLIAVVIRGTDGVEWQGNMDVTGSAYNSSENDHRSFKTAATNVEFYLDAYKVAYNISNPVYLVTGHSRGAAVANLLAEKLNTTSGTSNVYAYTFATPNATKTPNKSRTNIYNFCFDDDFVPQVPLDEDHSWGYGKHGITFTKTAGILYNSNTLFKNDMNRFLGRNADFNLSGTQELLDHVSDKWANLEEYYNNSCYSGSTLSGTAIPVNPTDALNPLSWTTLYKFFHDEVAKAAMGDIVAGIQVALKAENYYFGPISSFFVSGQVINKYINDAHSPFTYYTAVKRGLFQ